jgi:protein-disulfide isomerase
MTEKSETVTIKKDTLWKIVAGVFALLFIVTFLGKGDTTTPTQPTAPAPQDEFPIVSLDMKKAADDDAFIGNADAPVTIIEFSDYECPFCGRFFAQTLPSIKSKYIDTGKVRLVYRDFPLSFHANAQKAAEAAECAGQQGKYFEMHDKIFQGQTSLSVDNFKKWAADISLNTATFNTCLDSGATVAEIQKDLQEGTAYGVRGTPGFFVGKTNGNTAQLISGAYPFQAFEQIIDAALQ